MQHIFIINPNAGKADQTENITKAVQQLYANHEFEGTYIIERTNSREETINIAKKYAESGKEVVLYACGGDGTLNDVLNGSIGHNNVALTHLPTGTGNDFIKYFGIDAKENFANLKELINGKVIDVDVIKIGEHYSLNLTNVGLDAVIAQNVSKFKKIPFIKGKTAYKLSIAYSFFTSTKHYMDIIIDGNKEEENCYTIAVFANSKYYGGSYYASPFSDIQDGLMDVILLPKLSRLGILKILPVYEKGKHLEEKYKDIVRYKQAKRVEMKTKEPIALCLDGEIITMKDPIIEVCEKKIKILVPQKYL